MTLLARYANAILRLPCWLLVATVQLLLVLSGCVMFLLVRAQCGLLRVLEE